MPVPHSAHVVLSRKVAMNADSWIAVVVATGLLGYLIYTLLLPEDF